jgi:GT2 family glycosyltransferase
LASWRSLARATIKPFLAPVWRRIWARVEQRVGAVERDLETLRDAGLATRNAADAIGALARELRAVRLDVATRLSLLEGDRPKSPTSQTAMRREAASAAAVGVVARTGDPEPRVSVVICTDGRSASLAKVLDSLRWLDGPRFEVCVVAGPTRDGTAEELSRRSGAIKAGACPIRNLSAARNIGIAMAAGEIIAFLDDDSVPEAEWLAELTAAYADPTVGGAGGFVHGPDGIGYQCRFATADRLGRAQSDWLRAMPELCFPLTATYPHLLGANCSFRRDALVALGGFDEEYEYYLDETDLACRMVDAGWTLAQVEGAHVHHRFLPSAERNAARVLASWYAVIKNRFYFGLLNGLAHYSAATVIRHADAFIGEHATLVEQAIADGRLVEADRARFTKEAESARRDGLARGAAAHRRLPDPRMFEAPPPFAAYPVVAVSGRRRVFCFLSSSRSAPDFSAGAIAIAALGDQVHAVQLGDGPDEVSFSDGVWTHSVGDTGRMRMAVSRIAARRRIDAACAWFHDEPVARIAADLGIALLRLETPLSRGRAAEDVGDLRDQLCRFAETSADRDGDSSVPSRRREGGI